MQAITQMIMVLARMQQPQTGLLY